MKNRILLWPLVIASALLLRIPCAFPAGRELTLSDELLFRTGSAFQGEGEYYRAVTEYKKLLILFPDSDRAEDVWFNIGMSYLKGGEYESAADAFGALRQKFQKGRYAAQSRLYEGLSFRKLKRYADAVVQLETVADEFGGGPEAPKALLQRALLALEVDDTDEMKSVLHRVVREYPGREESRNADQSLALARSLELPPGKSALLAGTLSAVLPGSGYFYAGMYGDGLSAFLVNALFIAGTATAINQHNYPTACIVGAVGLPFYIGNIYGAANAARRVNFAVRKDVEGRIVSLLEVKY